MSKKRICPYSGVEFVPKRSNQVFANRVNQIRFNNEKAFQKRKAKSLTNKALDKNREVLKSILDDKEFVDKSCDFLKGAGLHFGYYTHKIENEGEIWSCVYDYAYAHVGPNLYRITCTNR